MPVVSPISIAGPSLLMAMSEAWFSGRRSEKSTKSLSSIFFSSDFFRAGGVKGFLNGAHGVINGNVPDLVLVVARRDSDSREACCGCSCWDCCRAACS